MTIVNTRSLFYIGITLVVIVSIVWGCEIEQMRQGCRIHNRQCLCGIGCETEYRYTSKEECRKALKGRRNDICRRNPCLNGGACTQTSLGPGYKCRCVGTGYYGSRCQHACPTHMSPQQTGQNFPYECIVI